MVTKLPLPAHDPIAVFESVLGERKAFKEFYKQIEADWRARIELYIESKGNPCDIFPLDLVDYTESHEEAESRKKSLIALYTPKEDKQPFQILSQMRRSHGLICCPSCGEPGVPDTLDHYLPKDVFPELSVLIVNLIPMCSTCQTAKGTQYVTESSDKKFIHAYYDEVDGPLYKILFHGPYHSPTFSLVVNSGLDEDMILLVANHIDGIDLKSRFTRFFPTKYLHLLKLAAKSRESKTLRACIQVILSMEEYKSMNSWEAAFYRGVLNDVELMDFLENGTLPLNL